MVTLLPDVLSPDVLAAFRQALQQAQWEPGLRTAGHLAQRVKANEQLPADSAVGQRLGDALLDRLGRHDGFLAAALPLKILPPRFNRHRDGGHYGDHVDAAIFSVPGTPHRIRSDLSVTVFLSDPAEYDGGELVIADGDQQRRIRLPAGHAVIYPASHVHQVTAVTRGERLAAFFWVQSLVRDGGRRRLLLDLDATIRQLAGRVPDDPALAALTGLYHNLLRQWAQT